MTIYYLYVKTHRITGLKYLGKTKRNPLIYPGSGVYWKRHLVVHGKAHETEILKECQSNQEIKHWGKYYSDLWDIVNAVDNLGNKIWANLKPEEGDGGFVDLHGNNPMKDPEIKRRFQVKIIIPRNRDIFGNYPGLTIISRNPKR
jgi:hypothetical protein